MAKIDLTAERVRELFDYNQDTGVFTYSSPELAHEAYLNAKRRLHAGCTI